MRSSITLLHRTLLIACFAVWFGGFTFYTAWVVPIGTDVLGSATEQGFITRQVTRQLNGLGGLALVWALLEWIAGWSRRGKAFHIGLGLSLAAMAILWLVLLFLHPHLDRMLDPADRLVLESERFYGWHRVYLWCSTVQWIFAWVWLGLTVADWSTARGPSRRDPAPATDSR